MKKIITILLIANLGWSAALYFQPSHDTFFNYIYNLSYALNYMVAAVVSFSFIKKYPNHRLLLSLLCLGSTFYTIAQFIWLYYNLISHTAVPYPGLADLFWLSFYALTVVSWILLMRKVRIHFTAAKIVEVGLTYAIVFFMMYSFLASNFSQESLPLLTRFLNLLYPGFDTLLITLAITTLRSQFGNLKSQLLFFIFAFITLSFADTIFSYQVSLEMYWNGNMVDGLFALGSYLFTMGILSLPTILPETEKSTPSITT